MKSILFLDDEPNILTGIKRMLYPFAQSWEMAFCTSVDEAHTMLRSHPFDVIVSDYRMPGCDGVTFLRSVREGYPHIARIMLSGFSDADAVLGAVESTHQYLSKPCSAGVLAGRIHRLLVSGSAIPVDWRQKITALSSIPCDSHRVFELKEIVESDDPDPLRIAEIVRRDIGMSMRFLQLANSNYFGTFGEISSIVTAVKYLGIQKIKDLLVIPDFFSCMKDDEDALCMKRLNVHGACIGNIARKISRSRLFSDAEIEVAYLVGLFHEVGSFIKGLIEDDVHVQTLDESTTMNFAAYFMALWGLPESIIQIATKGSVLAQKMALDSLSKILIEASYAENHIAFTELYVSTQKDC